MVGFPVGTVLRTPNVAREERQANQPSSGRCGRPLYPLWRTFNSRIRHYAEAASATNSRASHGEMPASRTPRIRTTRNSTGEEGVAGDIAVGPSGVALDITQRRCEKSRPSSSRSWLRVLVVATGIV